MERLGFGAVELEVQFLCSPDSHVQSPNWSTVSLLLVLHILLQFTNEPLVQSPIYSQKAKMPSPHLLFINISGRGTFSKSHKNDIDTLLFQMETPKCSFWCQFWGRSPNPGTKSPSFHLVLPRPPQDMHAAYYYMCMGTITVALSIWWSMLS
jgi:hypothetical protein